MKVPVSVSKVKGRSSGDNGNKSKKKKKKLQRPLLEASGMSPNTALGLHYTQMASRGQPNLKRLQHNARPVHASGEAGCPAGQAKARAGENANGGSGARALSVSAARPEGEMNPEELDSWCSFARRQLTLSLFPPTPPEVRKDLLSEVSSDSCLILLEPLDTPLTRFLQSLPEHQDLFGLGQKESSVQLAGSECPFSPIGVFPLKGSSGQVTSQSYSSALGDLVSACREESEGYPIILVCGSKNVGKSTFNRHLINTLLNHTVSVDYLECDVGQTEFTPPGCLSLLSVTEPLLGPPFSHQRPPARMVFFGESSVERDLDRYLESVKYLWRFYRRETPIVVNTMGWVKGFGFQLLVDLIRLLSVTHVVQISHGDTSQFPALTPAYLRSATGWLTTPRVQRSSMPTEGEETQDCMAAQGHTLLSVQSEFEGAGEALITKYHSNVLRDLALLGYFSQLQDPEPGPARSLNCFTPYQVPMSSVALRVTHCEVAPAHVLYTANASLVGLCVLAEKVGGAGGPVLLSRTPVCECLGFGVLRGVDVPRGLYFVVTPVPPSVLRQVNCLLLGGVTLPHTLLRTQLGAEGECPYITSDYSFDISGAGKLRVQKGLKRREHLGAFSSRNGPR
ncbi:NOL9 kinase, partial [Atractosteus spatula]|nr:NOL9 kinase [Atractosteus spatula]